MTAIVAAAINGPKSNRESARIVLSTASSFRKLTNYILECDLIFDFVREAIGHWPLAKHECKIALVSMPTIFYMRILNGTRR